MSPTHEAELDQLKANLAASTCCGKPASKRQQAIRKRRIAELEKLAG
jgi:bacterioferritin-associated ferredoxin